MVPICTEWWCTEANEATQTHCYNPVTPAYPIWAYYAHGRQRRCQEVPVGLPSGRLEKTTRSSPHHVAQHRPTGSETTPPYAPQSSRFGSGPPSVEDDVDVWRYAVVSCMPETTTTVWTYSSRTYITAFLYFNSNTTSCGPAIESDLAVFSLLWTFDMTLSLQIKQPCDSKMVQVLCVGLCYIWIKIVIRRIDFNASYSRCKCVTVSNVNRCFAIKFYAAKCRDVEMLKNLWSEAVFTKSRKRWSVIQPIVQLVCNRSWYSWNKSHVRSSQKTIVHLRHTCSCRTRCKSNVSCR